MQDETNRVLNIPFTKPRSDNTLIEFQIIDMKTLLEIKSDHDLEYPHRLAFNLIMVVVKGQGTHHIDLRSYNYTKGTIFFIKKDQAHAFKMIPELHCYLLQFTDNFLNRLVKNSVYDIFDYMRYPANMQLNDKDLKDILNTIDILNNQLTSDDDTFKEPILQSLLQSLLLQLKRKRVKQILDFHHKDQMVYQEFLTMAHHSHRYSLKVDDYARRLDISTRTLTNLLKKYTGRSTKTYLNEFLLLEIKRYLLDDSLTIQEIANRLDFDEPTNLIKFFKKFEDMTPHTYKQTKSL